MPALPAAVLDGADEACPVCKQTRYLNPNISFKINPECYHRMCESCIERIFMSGPAPCPVAGCGKTLRRARFRKQTFADLAIERECDIRRRVNAVLNKREEDFENLRAFNDYQETKEDITWKLINREDVASTEKMLKKFEQEHKAEIERNRLLEEQERKILKLEDEERMARSAEGRDGLRRQLAEERAARERAARVIVESIVGAKGDPEEAARQARERAKLERGKSARSAKTETRMEGGRLRRGDALEQLGSAGSSAGLSFAGIRKVEKKGPEVPYDAFGGLRIEPKYYQVRDGGEYQHAWLENAKKEQKMLAGGYDVRDYCMRAVSDAHAGLGILLSKEKAQATA